MVAIQWKNVGNALPAGLRLPETFGAELHRGCCAWPDTSITGLTSVALRTEHRLATAASPGTTDATTSTTSVRRGRSRRSDPWVRPVGFFCCRKPGHSLWAHFSD